MALHMIAQTINEKRVATLYVEGTADDVTAIMTLLEGSYDDYESSVSVGSFAPLPTTLNRVSFKVDKPVMRSGRKISCGTMFTIPHLKPAKSSDSVITAITGVFDKNYVSAEACTSAKLVYDKLSSAA